MIHYLWYNSFGQIGGSNIMEGGFPPEIDPRDPSTTDPTALWIRQEAQSYPDHQGWDQYDCPHASEVGTCLCPHLRYADSYVELPGVSLSSRDHTDFVLDGEVVTLSLGQDVPNIKQATVDKPASTTVPLKLKEKAPGSVPDGTVVEVNAITPALLYQSTFELTFTDGETNEVSLNVPALDSVGGIQITQAKYAAICWLYVRGA